MLDNDIAGEVFDFVVVGSGAGSMCAALWMRAMGKSVVIVEKDALIGGATARSGGTMRSEEHTSELQSLMRISYAVFCLKKKNKKDNSSNTNRSKQQSSTTYT